MAYFFRYDGYFSVPIVGHLSHSPLLRKKDPTCHIRYVTTGPHAVSGMLSLANMWIFRFSRKINYDTGLYNNQMVLFCLLESVALWRFLKGEADSSVLAFLIPVPPSFVVAYTYYIFTFHMFTY